MTEPIPVTIETAPSQIEILKAKTGGSELELQSTKELKKIASGLGIKGYSSLNKKVLIGLINDELASRDRQQAATVHGQMSEEVCVTGKPVEEAKPEPSIVVIQEPQQDATTGGLGSSPDVQQQQVEQLDALSKIQADPEIAAACGRFVLSGYVAGIATGVLGLYLLLKVFKKL